MPPSPGPSPTPHLEGPAPLEQSSSVVAPARTLAKVALVAVLALVVTAGVAHTLFDLLREGEDAGPLSLDPLLVCLAGLLWSVGIAAQGPRWAALLPHSDGPPGIVRSALAVLGTNALTVTIPGPSGEALLAAFCERDLGIPWATGAAAKFLSRLVGLALLGGLLLAGVAVIPGAAAWAPGWMAGLASLTIGVVFLGVYWFSSRGLRSGAAALLVRLPPPTRARLEEPVLAIVDHALAPKGQPAGMWVRAAAWSLVSTGFMGAGGYASAVAVGVAPDLGVYLWMHVVSSVAGLVGMVIPAGLGLLDALWAALFVVTAAPGVAPTLAFEHGLMAAVAWRQMQAISLLISLGPLAWVGRRTSG